MKDMAPEMLLQEKDLCGKPLGMYSFGVLLYEMVFGTNPFVSLGGKEQCASALPQPSDIFLLSAQIDCQG